MKKFLHNLSIATAVFLGAMISSPAQECFTPLEWIPKNYVSNLDRNKNFVDDEIELMNPGEYVDIIVCLNSCFSDEDVEMMAGNMGIQPVYRSPYISLMIFEGVSVATAIALGQHERVAMVELGRTFIAGNDVATRAARIRSSTQYSGANVQDNYPTIDGSGVNIAIFDTGVDNVPSGGGTGHESFPAWKFVAGYNGITDIETDPDDDNGHGTHVAGIALGTGGPSGTYRGNAPGAGLIDIKAGNSGGSFSTLAITRSLDKLIQRRVAWNVGIVNMSIYAAGANSNGTDAFSQHVNRVVREGIVAVVIAGNDGTSGTGPGGPGNFIGPIAASDFAITVASAYDQGTVLRTGDVISSFSSRGPRLNDGDGMTTDEDKPDVTAYGQTIHSASHNTTTTYRDDSGTSMAAPQVAGLAALILQTSPGMTPLSVKDLIESTADDFGTPNWDVAFGHGIINGYTAIDQLMTSLKTDLAFSVWCNKPGTSPHWWQSPDVVPLVTPILESSPNGVTVTIYNNGPNISAPAKVRVGVFNFSNSNTDFDICLKDIPSLNVGQSYTFTCTPWTPEINGVPPGTVHACLKAFIIYPNDSDPSNNCAQRNIDIQQTHSPAVFNMTVVNPTGKNLLMEMATDPPLDEIAAEGWQISFSEQSFTMGAIDCPKTVTIEMEAVGAAFGDVMPVTIIVQGREEGQGERMELGGVQIIAENANGTPRPPDGVIFKGIRHTSLGEARLWSSPARLIVSQMDGGMNDGVSAWLGEADFWQGVLEDFNVDDYPDGSFISFTPVGNVAGAPGTNITTLTVTDDGDHAQFSIDIPGTPDLYVDVYDDGSLVGNDVVSSNVFANAWPPLAGMKLTPYRSNDDEYYAEVVFSEDTQIDILGPAGISVVGDRMVARWAPDAMVRPDYVEKVDIIAEDREVFVLTDEAGGAYERPFRALGNPVLEWQDAGQTLRAERITARSAVGARAKVPELDSYDLYWEGKDITDVPTGTHLYVTAKGTMSGTPVDLGNVWIMRDINGAHITANMASIGASSYSVEVYNGGALMYSGSGFSSAVGSVSGWPHGGGHAISDATGGPSFRMYWPGDVAFLFDTWSGNGDEIRIIAEGVGSLDGVTEVGAFVIGLDELVIISEEASSSIPVAVGTPGQELPFRLYQNYPNPFDQRTMFKFDLFSSAYVELEVYNLIGEKVASVVTREFPRGTHEVEWKRSTTSLPSGAYIYRIKVQPSGTSETFELQRQMVILD